MSLEAAIDLVVCGALLVGMVLLAQRYKPDLAGLTFYTGLGGGTLCVLWGVLGRRTWWCRISAMVTLALVACVLAHQAVRSWGVSVEGAAEKRMVAALMAVMVVICIGVLVKLVRSRKESVA